MSIEVKSLSIEGPKLIFPRVFRDERGYFIESYNKRDYEEAGIGAIFVQDNLSRSVRGTLRGLHFQIPPHSQAKLVTVLEGRVFDVAVDIRRDSPTYGKHVFCYLDGEQMTQFYIPRGFAHGFLVLSEFAVFAYKCDNFYAPSHEGGLIYDDPDLAISWPSELLEGCSLILSEKDSSLPRFSQFDSPF